MNIAVMSFGDVWVWPVVIIAAVGFICALFLRWAGITRPGTAAGAAAGLLCGLTVLGNTMPNRYHQWFTGGTQERHTVEKLEEQHKADLLALTSTGVSPVAVVELKERQRKEMEEAQEAYDLAVWNHQRGVRTVGLVSAAFVFGWLLPIGWRRRGSIGEHQSRGGIEGNGIGGSGIGGGGIGGGGIGGGGDAFFIHWWMFILVTGFVGALMLLVFHWSRLESLAVGLTFAVPCMGLRMLPRVSSVGSGYENNKNNDDNEQGDFHDDALITRVALIGWMVGLIIFITAIVLKRPVGTATSLSQYGIRPTTLAVAGLVLVIGVLLRTRCADGKKTGVCSVGFISSACSFVFVPFVTAVLCLHIDLLSNLLLWPVAAAMLVGGDGRWFAAACGMRMTGRPWRYALNGAPDLADAGAMQVVVGFVLFTAGWITAPAMAAVVVAGAVVGDVTVEKRRSLIRKWREENESDREIKS